MKEIKKADMKERVNKKGLNERKNDRMNERKNEETRAKNIYNNRVRPTKFPDSIFNEVNNASLNFFKELNETLIQKLFFFYCSFLFFSFSEEFTMFFISTCSSNTHQPAIRRCHEKYPWIRTSVSKVALKKPKA